MKVNNTILIILGILALGFFTGYIQLPTSPGAVGGGNVAPTQTGGGGTVSGQGCILASAQSLTGKTYNFDKPGTAVTSGYSYLYTNPSQGILAAGNGSTQVGKTYTAYTVVSGYFAATKTVTTPCTETPTINDIAGSYMQKDQDAAISMSVLEDDGLSLISSSNNQSIGAGASATFYLRLKPSALYLHLSGESNKYAVFLNFTNSSQWDPTGFSVYSFTGKKCEAYSGTLPAAIVGHTYGYVCEGDFTGNDMAYYQIPITVKTATGLSAGACYAGIWVGGLDWYQNTISGALQEGVVKDDGSAIQTLQSTNIGFTA